MNSVEPLRRKEKKKGKRRALNVFGELGMDAKSSWGEDRNGVCCRVSPVTEGSFGRCRWVTDVCATAPHLSHSVSTISSRVLSEAWCYQGATTKIPPRSKYLPTSK